MNSFGPELNDGKHIFVFGSNKRGIHGAGAAKQAARFWGAHSGIAEGFTGNAYAIPTKEHWSDKHGLPLDEIRESVNRFIAVAGTHPELTFLVTAIGTGYAGHKPEDIAPMFKDAPSNCVLPDGWRACESR